MSMNETIQSEIIAAIQQHDCIDIISHFRPDGDAIGSTLALGLALQQLGKNVRMWNTDGVPARFAFLEGAEQIQILPETPQLPELLICVDTGDFKRVGDKAMAHLKQSGLIINIDHHGSNSLYGHINLVEAHAAACGVVLYKLIREMGAEITTAIATALYTAISTDTGSFQYSSTTAEVMETAGDLIRRGVEVGEVNRMLYQELSQDSIRVTREVLNEMKLQADGQIAWYAMTAGTKDRLGVSLEETKDLVDIIRVIRGVKAAVIFEDLEDGRIRVSLRSKDARLNVSDIAALFGGGGHAMASGIRMKGTLDECVSQVLAAIEAELEKI